MTDSSPPPSPGTPPPGAPPTGPFGWLREIGFMDVDCVFKWLELAVMVAKKPTREEGTLTAPA